MFTKPKSYDFELFSRRGCICYIMYIHYASAFLQKWFSRKLVFIMKRLIKGKVFDFTISEPELYVDNESRGRSGHMSHAMTEYEPGKLLAFNMNVSPKRNGGHGQYGWVEYRRSLDAGKTFGEINTFPFSWDAFLDGKFTIACEKALTCPDGTVVVFCLRNSPYNEICSEPFYTPYYVTSSDGGVSWGEPKEFSPWAGRIYDAVMYEGDIYVVQFCNDSEIHWTGRLPEHVYRIFKSSDNAKTFKVISTVPQNTLNRGYGSLLFRPDGSLIFYCYNRADEVNMDYMISYDKGITWTCGGRCYLEKGIRNPQTVIWDSQFILHGRGSCGRGFMLYTSSDGINWDEGFAIEPNKELCYYSNNIVIGDKVLLQYSDAYNGGCVNVMHAWLEKA